VHSRLAEGLRVDVVVSAVRRSAGLARQGRLGLADDRVERLDNRARVTPAAVSPESMIASTPSSTPFAASLASARVRPALGRHRLENLRGEDDRNHARRGHGA
jgi:hypothetical protein